MLTIPKATQLISITYSALISAMAFSHSGEFHAQLVDADKTLSDTPVAKTYVKGNKRIIESNGIPEHEVGRFPNRGNPHTIKAQNYRFEIPLNPKKAEEPTILHRQPWGVATNGIPFDPGTAEYYKKDRKSPWNYEALSGKVRLGLDTNHAHVQPSGAYHYHGLPTALFDELKKETKQMIFLGWAADGFPIYGLHGYKDSNDSGSELVTLRSSYQIKSGQRPSGEDQPEGDYDGSFTLDYEYIEGSGDLDECGGRTGVTPEFPEGTYYYMLTDDYPFIPRMFKGTPDPSFERRRGNRRTR